MTHWELLRQNKKKIKSPDGGWQSQPKHVALNKMIKLVFV